MNNEWLAPLNPLVEILARLLGALVMGVVVAFIYRRARREPASSFTTTLVMLAVLIAMVTQVVGDNIARAFSLVGALSIVRFRTVVRDTQDTAYVIFAVAVGMAIGAGHITVALAGMAVIGLAALLTRPPAAAASSVHVHVRVDPAVDLTAEIGRALAQHGRSVEIIRAGTARQGAAVELSYRVALRTPSAPETLVLALRRVEGVQGVSLRAGPVGNER